MQPSDSCLQELLSLTLLKCLLFRWEVLSLGCWQSYFLQSLSPWLVDSHLRSVPGLPHTNVLSFQNSRVTIYSVKLSK